MDGHVLGRINRQGKGRTPPQEQEEENLTKLYTDKGNRTEGGR